MKQGTELLSVSVSRIFKFPENHVNGHMQSVMLS